VASLSASARLNDAVGQVPARAGANPLGGLVRQSFRRDMTLMSIIVADPILKESEPEKVDIVDYH
jgi:hypothetical protein